jgi:hypothetical protein
MAPPAGACGEGAGRRQPSKRAAGAPAGQPDSKRRKKDKKQKQKQQSSTGTAAAASAPSTSGARKQRRWLGFDPTTRQLDVPSKNSNWRYIDGSSIDYLALNCSGECPWAGRQTSRGLGLHAAASCRSLARSLALPFHPPPAPLPACSVHH